MQVCDKGNGILSSQICHNNAYKKTYHGRWDDILLTIQMIWWFDGICTNTAILRVKPCQTVKCVGKSPK